MTIQPQQAEKIGCQGRVACHLSLTAYFCLLYKPIKKTVATKGRDTLFLYQDKKVYQMTK